VTLYLLAPTMLRVAPADLPARVGMRFADGLRRTGTFGQLGLLGAQTCLDAAGGNGPLGVLWASALGSAHATRAMLHADLRHGESAMPIAFIGTQPHLAAVLLAQRSHPIKRTAFLHLGPHAWSWLPLLAQSWLDDCEQLLVGWVEESDTPDVAHRSDWCMLQAKPADGSLRCEPTPDRHSAVTATSQDWIARVAAWPAEPGTTLLLRGDDEAWSFAAGG
jgi:hypothetical protein